MMRLPLVLFLLGVSSSCQWGPRADPRLMDIFDSAAALLDRAAKAPAAVVPDAVLNRARCLVVVPAAQSEKPAEGVATCRADAESWQTPWLVRFDPSARPDGAVVLMVLTDTAADRLADGVLDLTGHRTAPAAPVAAKMVVVTDADLTTDAVAYSDDGSGLAGKPVEGTFTVLSHRPVGKELEFSDRLLAAVTSFFNTITPMGIILHHSAVLPGDQTVPTMDELDSFHRQRGFDIRCQGREYHVAYHYLVLPDGSVKKGRPDRCEGAHARGYNSFLGIAVLGDFSGADNPHGEKGPTAPTPQQMQAVAALCRKLMKQYDIPLQRVLRHSDVGTTRCPGDRFPFAELLRKLQAPS